MEGKGARGISIFPFPGITTGELLAWDSGEEAAEEGDRLLLKDRERDSTYKMISAFTSALQFKS